jgi:type IV pilus assembly protein PilC
VVQFTVIERFCRVLTAMVQAGVPVPEALRLATTGANNSVYEKSLVVARAEMLEGEGMARPIARTGLFPGTVTQMIRVGEETGTLDAQLQSVASYYEQELEYKLKRLTNLFEPLAIILVGTIVGFVAIALISAIYGIYNQVHLK